ncbi:putative FAD-linked oxidoreductase [bacterium MnTg02]|nr:putative FAD-linked oxidoreductase [bacterium MnTg02]
MSIADSTSKPEPNVGIAGAALETLKAQFGDRLAVGQAIREQHGHTLTWIPNQPPDAVVFPQSAAEVRDVVNVCAAHQIPLIPFGAGTSLEGHLNAPAGGISIDLSRMNNILSVNSEDLDCVVEAGVTRKQLNSYLRDTGLFFAVDPGADATLGGMAATRASGTNAVRYGTMRENVINLTAVMADGSIVRSASRARKSSAGYDLTHLIVGSEGTLGVITELTVRLYGIPESIVSGVCPFDTVEGACDTVIMAMQIGLKPARIELLDPLQVKACNKHSKLTLAETPTLFLEFHGTEAGTAEEIERFREIANDFGGGTFEWARETSERNQLWAARHDAYWAALELRPGTECFVGDVCVPISRLAECVKETIEDIHQSGLIAPIVGHVGDGNFHVMPLVDMNNTVEVQGVTVFFDRLVERALRMDGTCTGEHGVGSGKVKYMQAEHGPGIEVMRAIKKALDPLNILNPGKIIPM